MKIDIVGGIERITKEEEKLFRFFFCEVKYLFWSWGFMRGESWVWVELEENVI